MELNANITAVVTGGASGLGEATARKLATRSMFASNRFCKSTSLSAVAASDHGHGHGFGRSSGLTVSLSIWGISKCH